MKTLSALLAALCALLFTVSAMAATTVNFGTLTAVNGPDDLDLAGEMAYAVNFSPNDPALLVKGVKFVPDTLLPLGLTVGPNNVAPWQTKPAFGSGIDPDNLEEIYQDIRWANNTPPAPQPPQLVEAHLPVTAGQTYKLQVLFYGNHAADDRRWDIEVEGAVGVDEVTSLGISTGPAPGNLPPYSSFAGLVYTHTVVAGDATLDVRMGNISGAFDAGDRNALWQGLTVEHIVIDSEPDGLPDAWETATFGNLSQTGAGDADSDGLSNQYEYQLGSNPGQPHSDADGVPDGQEYFELRTNPLLSDTDGDGLNDNLEDADGDGVANGPELLTHHTNPADRDSDDDEYLDGIEIASGTNPNSAASFPLYATQVLSFFGGDVGEGLDLTGNFKAAARFGLNAITGSWPVRDATFVPFHSVPGLTHNSFNEIDLWVNMTFPGPVTPADSNLATVMHSIRFQGGLFSIDFAGLTVGRSYKVQLLFAEFCCPSRGFDVYVENTLVADEFSPPAVHGGASLTPAAGAAVVYGFVATDTTLNIKLDKSTVTTPALGDVNAILSALTVEEVPVGADSDGDGLPDQWEIDHFDNIIAQNGFGDPDNDGLPNSAELVKNTDPNDPDTDNDGLTDGTEVNTSLTNPVSADTDSDGLNDGPEISVHFTDPRIADTDRDTLLDGAEVNTLNSSPLVIDSDADGFNDPTEVLNGTNPAPTPAGFASKPGGTHLSRVLGPDAAEGLDLFGNFLYAFNVGTPGAAGPVHDANFTSDSAPGITLSAPFQEPGWFNPDFGSSANENALEFVYQSIRWADAPNRISLDLAGLTPGRQYKLQLMFVENCCPGRFFDVSVDGVLLADEFNPASTQGSNLSNIAGGAIVHTFTATATTVSISLDGSTTQAGNDHNATLSGVTLEALVNTIPIEVTGVTRLPAGLKLDIRGTPAYAYSVDWSPDLLTWIEVNDALTTDALGNATWTDTDITRVGPLIRRSFYKLRDPALDPTP